MFLTLVRFLTEIVLNPFISLKTCSKILKKNSLTQRHISIKVRKTNKKQRIKILKINNLNQKLIDFFQHFFYVQL